MTAAVDQAETFSPRLALDLAAPAELRAARERVAALDARAAADPAVAAAREKAEKFAAQLAAARTELSRATALTDQKAAAVRAAIAAGDPYDLAEKDRDRAADDAARLARRVDDLAAVAGDAARAAQALHDLTRRTLRLEAEAAARAELAAVDRAVADTTARHARELLAASRPAEVNANRLLIALLTTPTEKGS